jgi:FkbM family methyltransferase
VPDLALPDTPRWISAVSRVIRALPAGRYRAMNWVAGRGSAPFWARLPDDLGGLQYRCDLRDVLMREVCITGRYEPQETILIQNILGPGMTFVDVGANWGYFTLGAAHLVGASGRVVSVEADPRAAETLSGNVVRNDLASVRVVGTAASDRDQILTFFSYGSSSDRSANFGVALGGLPGDGRPCFDVRARPLDSILDDHGVERVDLLKMDIEGAERRALAGLGRRLGAGLIDRIILELHPDHLRAQGDSVEAVVSGLEAQGYVAWLIDHSPATHARAASARLNAHSLLAPLTGARALALQDRWPHVLFAYRGLGPLSSHQRSDA